MNKGDGIIGIVCVFLLIACWFDYRRGKIPNYLVAIMVVTGLIRCWLTGGGASVPVFLLIEAGVMLCLYPLFKIGALGAGDVKLFGACAGYFPVVKVFSFLFCSLLVAAMISLVKLLMERNVKERLCYFADYILEVVHSGCWSLYMENERDYRKAGICLSGPALCSVLLYLGGVY